MTKRIILTLGLILVLNALAFVPVSMAQGVGEAEIEMADHLRAEGKIYVVVLVVGIVFTGLTIYAVNTDRRLTKLEKEIQNLKSGKG